MPPGLCTGFSFFPNSSQPPLSSLLHLASTLAVKPWTDTNSSFRLKAAFSGWPCLPTVLAWENARLPEAFTVRFSQNLKTGHLSSSLCRRVGGSLQYAPLNKPRWCSHGLTLFSRSGCFLISLTLLILPPPSPLILPLTHPAASAQIGMVLSSFPYCQQFLNKICFHHLTNAWRSLSLTGLSEVSYPEYHSWETQIFVFKTSSYGMCSLGQFIKTYSISTCI